MDDAVRSGEDVVVTALPLYHIFALMVNFISLLLDRRGELADRQSPLHGRLRRYPAPGALHRLDRREHAVRRARDAPEDFEGGLQQAAGPAAAPIEYGGDPRYRKQAR
jgi:hypothetical protein